MAYLYIGFPRFRSYQLLADNRPGYLGLTKGYNPLGIPKNLLRDRPELSEWCILHTYRGSIAHGMYIPKSDPNSIDDKDTMAVCVPPPDYYVGLQSFARRGTREIKYREWDIVVYEAKKAINLLLKGNPNVLSLLWVSPNHYIKRTPAGDLLVENRQIFVGRHVYRSFVGYAHAQLHRMTHHAFEGYMGAKRKELVEKFGYDVKNAGHLVRLLRMGIEFLRDGELYVERHDAQQLLEIKRGEWALERVQEEASRLFRLAEETYLKCTLPKGPDRDRANEICMQVVQLAWEGR